MISMLFVVAGMVVAVYMLAFLIQLFGLLVIAGGLIFAAKKLWEMIWR